MKQIKFHEITPGKTIKAFECETGYRFTILFTDDTFVSAELSGGGEVWVADDEIDLNDLGSIRDADKLIEFGIIDREAYEAAQEAQSEKDRLRVLEYKRQQYEFLKKELGL